MKAVLLVEYEFETSEELQIRAEKLIAALKDGDHVKDVNLSILESADALLAVRDQNKGRSDV